MKIWCIHVSLLSVTWAKYLLQFNKEKVYSGSWFWTFNEGWTHYFRPVVRQQIIMGVSGGTKSLNFTRKQEGRKNGTIPFKCTSTTTIGPSTKPHIGKILLLLDRTILRNNPWSHLLLEKAQCAEYSTYCGQYETKFSKRPSSLSRKCINRTKQSREKHKKERKARKQARKTLDKKLL